MIPARYEPSCNKSPPYGPVLSKTFGPMGMCVWVVHDSRIIMIIVKANSKLNSFSSFNWNDYQKFHSIFSCVFFHLNYSFSSARPVSAARINAEWKSEKNDDQKTKYKITPQFCLFRAPVDSVLSHFLFYFYFCERRRVRCSLARCDVPTWNEFFTQQ